jgi:hypothetical protein
MPVFIRRDSKLGNRNQLRKGRDRDSAIESEIFSLRLICGVSVGLSQFFEAARTSGRDDFWKFADDRPLRIATVRQRASILDKIDRSINVCIIYQR